ncbi:hypothetical protein QN277_029034 [Acacia crassicarpa]|uniref:Uncharacterized protein n=1 Tax=Acacia crassicarpa TaxID=499986 RepID=A0AAE1MDT5_9FABA|nr:hypothetical protein QN277_029034 [Acacia crassicarpa]
MKLDGELAFYHSNIGKPESQSFEFDVNDPYSAGCRSEDQEAMENENRVSVDLEPNKGNLGSVPSKMETEDALITSPKRDSGASVVGLRNENEESPTDPCPDCPQDIEPVESSDIPGVVDSPKNLADLFMDKSVTECEPELVVVYKESSDHVIKDICVDEGIPAEEKILLENTNEDAAHKFSSSEEDHKSEKFAKDNVAVDAPFPVFIDVPAITEESDKVTTNHYKFEDLMLHDDEETGKFANDVDKEMLLAGYKVLLQDLDEEQLMPLIEEGNKAEQNYSQVSGELELPSRPKESEDRVEEAVSTSALAAEESTSDVSNAGMPENGSVTSHSDPPVAAAAAAAAAASAKDESDQVGGEPKLDDAQNSSESVYVKPDDHQAVTSHERHSLGETSFSAVGRVSSRITYLDPVPYSGSISLRSDSSTTSTRSFAFPQLQSEWNCSPVRMAKADRRHYRKHRGWRQGLLCCRF